MEILGLIVLLIGLVIFMLFRKPKVENNLRRDLENKISEIDDRILDLTKNTPEISHDKHREIEKKLGIGLSESERIEFLTKKYNSDIAIKIIKGKLEIGMSSNMVIDMKGRPDHKTQSVSKNAAREEWFYGTYKNRLKNISYKFRVVLVNEKVTGWNDINN